MFSGMSMIDELNKKLIGELQKDGRQTYANLGKVLGVSEGAIRKRFKNLIKRGLVKVVAVPDMRGLGYNFVGIVGIQVKMAELKEVWENLSQDPAVCQLFWVIGRYDLIALIAAQSVEEFANFMSNELFMISGVAKTETFVTLGMRKGEMYSADTTELVNNLNVSPQKKPRTRQK